VEYELIKLKNKQTKIKQTLTKKAIEKIFS